MQYSISLHSFGSYSKDKTMLYLIISISFALLR